MMAITKSSIANGPYILWVVCSTKRRITFWSATVAFGAKRTCRDRRRRINPTRPTQSGHRGTENLAVQRPPGSIRADELSPDNSIMQRW